MRLEVYHLCPEDRVFSRGDDALLRAKARLLGTTRDCKCLLEVFKRLPVLTDLLCKPILRRDGGDCNIGSVLSPQECLCEAVKLRKKKRSSLLLLRLRPGSCVHDEPLHEAVTETEHSPLCGKKLGVDVTEEHKRRR